MEKETGDERSQSLLLLCNGGLTRDNVPAESILIGIICDVVAIVGVNVFNIDLECVVILVRYSVRLREKVSVWCHVQSVHKALIHGYISDDICERNLTSEAPVDRIFAVQELLR